MYIAIYHYFDSKTLSVILHKLFFFLSLCVTASGALTLNYFVSDTTMLQKELSTFRNRLNYLLTAKLL